MCKELLKNQKQFVNKKYLKIFIRYKTVERFSFNKSFITIIKLGWLSDVRPRREVKDPPVKVTNSLLLGD
jgi:hypothetical protein